MERICIGIPVHAEPERLHATLASLRTYTQIAYDLLLLPDGPDAAMRSALSGLRDLPQSATAQPLGSPACFNRLAAFSSARVLVLLESGAQVGPRWLEHLLAALDADPRHGLAGPSTNRSWNEQAVFARAGNSAVEIVRSAQLAAQRFGSSLRRLEPLYSLADFCYVVRREVVDAIGGADEGYGLGPCWEMDYNIRAARAGWHGVWAQAAYVHRSPFTARRQQQERLCFEANKRRYQDKFCALRLGGQRHDYELHCCGDACEHFAPASMIQLTWPLPAANRPAPPAVSQPSPATAGQPSAPLVSCIMPTANRVAFALQAVGYFLRQDYPHKELIIVDDGCDDLASQLPHDPSIHYLRAPPGTSIGHKRNRACAEARGSIIAQWDDDDWYASNRLSVQVAPLLSGAADISALATWRFFDLFNWRFWQCTPALHRRLFVEDVHGGTLVYRRQVWADLARYPDRSLAEDALFLQQARRKGARLERLCGEGLFIYLRHAANSWRFECGRHLDPKGWQQTAEPPLSVSDRAFYAAQAAPFAGAATPLVSCIMPTYNRRPFVPQAIAYFLRQDYPRKELIIVDDGSDAVDDLATDYENIRYVRLAARATIGTKRNLACEEAGGDIILHWDDDDWMAPWRIRYQAEQLVKAQADICGLDHLFFCDPTARQAWEYRYTRAQRAWVAGNTLCYTRSFWRRNPFHSINVGEDTHFIWSRPDGRVLRLPDKRFFVGMIHTHNTSPKRTHESRWHAVDYAQIERMLGDDRHFYLNSLS